MIHKIPFDVTRMPIHMSKVDSVKYWLDGRRSGPLLEKWVSSQTGWKPSPSENSPFDAVDLVGKKVEVRCITKNIIFRPSDQIGKGRSFNEEDFISMKLNVVDYFTICDVNEEDLSTGTIYAFDISSKLVLDMYRSGDLGKNAQKPRKSFLKLMSNMKLYDRT